MTLGVRPTLIIWDDIEPENMENSNEQNFRIHLLARAFLFRRGTYGGEGYIGKHYCYSSLCSFYEIQTHLWGIHELKESTVNFFWRICEAKPFTIFSSIPHEDFPDLIRDLVTLLIHVSYLTHAEQTLLANLIIEHGSYQTPAATLHQLQQPQ